MKVKYTKEHTSDLVLDVGVLCDNVEGTLQEWLDHPRRLTLLREAEENAKEVLSNVKTLRKLYDKSTKLAK